MQIHLQRLGKSTQLLSSETVRYGHAIRVVFRNLEIDQWGLAKRLCQDNPSFVISSLNNQKACATEVSSIETKCFSETQSSSLDIKLSSVSGQLQIRCGSVAPEHPSGISSLKHHLKRRTWYVSTVLLNVTNIYREHICKVSLGAQNLKKNQWLIFMKTSMCNNNMTVSSLASGFTYDNRFHAKIGFPFVFNPTPVGSSHTHPFFMSSIGLYIDHISRISIRMSTTKPLTNLPCEINMKEYIAGHELSYP